MNHHWSHTEILTAAILLGCISILGFWLWLSHLRKKLADKIYSDSLKFPSGRSKYHKVGGIRLHYVVEGQGPDVLLIHGLGANIYCWRYLIPILSNYYRVWAVDLKGFGLSDKPRKVSYGLKAQADLLYHFMKEQKATPFHVVGNSMGGAIAAQIAISHPSAVQSLVMLNSAHDPKIVGLFDLRYFKAFAGVMSPFVSRPLVRQIIKQLYGKPKEVHDEWVDAYIAPYVKDNDAHLAFLSSFEALKDPHLTKGLKQTSVPTMIVWGENDKLVPIKFGKELHTNMESSHFVVHPEAGHHIQEEEPQWLFDQLHQFFKK